MEKPNFFFFFFTDGKKLQISYAWKTCEFLHGKKYRKSRRIGEKTNYFSVKQKEALQFSKDWCMNFYWEIKNAVYISVHVSRIKKSLQGIDTLQTFIVEKITIPSVYSTKFSLIFVFFYNLLFCNTSF